MNNIKISIIIAIYNNEQYLRQCLDSIVNQTLKEIEIICVNDGSTDNSLNILKEYASTDKRITIINQENKKPGVAKNKALELVKGEYTGFVDSDDWVELTMFEELYKKAKENDADIVTCESYAVENKSLAIKGINNLDCFPKMFDNIVFDINDIKDFIFDINICVNSKLHKTEFLKNSNAKFTEDLFFEDIVFGQITGFLAKRACILRKPLYYYRENLDSITWSKNEIYFDIIPVMDLLEKELEKLNLTQDLKHKFIAFKIDLFLIYFRKIDKAYKSHFYKLIRQNIIKMDKKNYTPESLRKSKRYLTYTLIKIINSNVAFDFFYWLTNLFYITEYKDFIIVKFLFKFKFKKRKTPFFYYKDDLNLGDLLNVEILTKICNENIEYTKPKTAELIAIGSILEYFLDKKNKLKNKTELKVWGSGFITPPNQNLYLNRKLKILALRGKLSKKEMENKLGYSLNDITLGDPGILASYLIDKNSIEKKYKVGIIPHYVDKEHSALDVMRQNIPNLKVIDVQDNLYSVLQEIAQCEVIISSSLHGLIVADSFGIPNQWAVFSDKIVGGEYKFRDYYSVYENMSEVTPINFNTYTLNETTINDIKANYKISYSKVIEIQKGLISAYKNK